MLHIDVVGLDEIKKTMKKLNEDLAVKVTREAVRDATKIIQKEAIRRFDANWNSRTGNLRASIKLVKRKRIDGERVSKYTPTYAVLSKRVYKRKTYTDAQGNKTRVKGLVADGWYARFLEYGTSKIVAKPFLRPAGENKKDEAFQYFKKTIVSKAKKIVG